MSCSKQLLINCEDLLHHVNGFVAGGGGGGAGGLKSFHERPLIGFLSHPELWEEREGKGEQK